MAVLDLPAPIVDYLATLFHDERRRFTEREPGTTGGCRRRRSRRRHSGSWGSSPGSPCRLATARRGQRRCVVDRVSILFGCRAHQHRTARSAADCTCSAASCTRTDPAVRASASAAPRIWASVRLPLRLRGHTCNAAAVVLVAVPGSVPAFTTIPLRAAAAYSSRAGEGSSSPARSHRPGPITSWAPGCRGDRGGNVAPDGPRRYVDYHTLIGGRERCPGDWLWWSRTNRRMRGCSHFWWSDAVSGPKWPATAGRASRWCGPTGPTWCCST